MISLHDILLHMGAILLTWDIGWQESYVEVQELAIEVLWSIMGGGNKILKFCLESKPHAFWSCC